jgi:hypothetical protein
MDAGVVVVLAVIGLVLLVPLAFAWVSTSARRWARVERVLGREPPLLAPRFIVGLWAGMGAAWVAVGVL